MALNAKLRMMMALNAETENTVMALNAETENTVMALNAETENDDGS